MGSGNALVVWSITRISRSVWPRSSRRTFPLLTRASKRNQGLDEDQGRRQKRNDEAHVDEIGVIGSVLLCLFVCLSVVCVVCPVCLFFLSVCLCVCLFVCLLFVSCRFFVFFLLRGA